MNTVIPTGAARSIGSILIESGRLSSTDANRIAEHQQQHGLQFGDAAIALKLHQRRHRLCPGQAI